MMDAVRNDGVLIEFKTAQFERSDQGRIQLARQIAMVEATGGRVYMPQEKLNFIFDAVKKGRVYYKSEAGGVYCFEKLQRQGQVDFCLSACDERDEPTLGRVPPSIIGEVEYPASDDLHPLAFLLNAWLLENGDNINVRYPL